MSTKTTQPIKANVLFQKQSLDTWRNTTDFVTDAIEECMRFFDDSVNTFTQFNTNQIESWFATFKRANN